ICNWEYEIISRSDLFILGHPLDPKVSPGMIWEWAFAKRLGIPIVNVHELILGNQPQQVDVEEPSR
ncbi:MAG: hypothetical protein ACE5Z5_15270, partial [Candidatus Bathyarchaeia archaeon]